MKLVVQLKLTPTADQARALTSTLEACNQAANEVSKVAFTTRVFRNYALRRLVYAQLRADGLGAQAAQHCIKKVADAYTTLRANLKAGNYGKPGARRRQKAESKPIAFRAGAAQPFDQRNLSFALDVQTVSLWTVNGRLKCVPFVAAPETLRLLAGCKRGEADLLHRDGLWLLLVTVEVPTGTHPATSPAGRLLCGTRGGSHPPLPPELALVAGRGRVPHRQ